MRHHHVALFAFVLASLGSHRANAFDSAGSEGAALRTLEKPIPSGSYPFPHNPDLIGSTTPNTLFGEVPSDSINGGQRYQVGIIHSAHGGKAGDLSDNGVAGGLMVCPRAPRQVNPDLTGCNYLKVKPQVFSNWGWVRTRKAWDKAEEHDIGGPEHYQIAKAALVVAGLGNNPLFTQPFWVRYPVKNRYVASPIEPDSDEGLFPKRDDFIVGQTWIPASFDGVEAHAVRGISLPELAQMPDASNTVWDWAAGNELCPLAGDISGAVKNEALIGACHDFAMVTGAINASHFMPSSRQFYRYYHQLARDRLAECSELADLKGSYYDRYEPGIGTLWGRTSSPNDTEAHECVREAFVYEMFAQHFLQDAWSTGHMWARFGSPNLQDFPDTVGDPWGDNPSIPAANRPARRLVVAGLVGAFSGMIHGARAVHAKKLRSWHLYPPPSFIDKLIDDPLSGSTFLDPATGRFSFVEWRDESSGQVHFGVGDLFWNPSNPNKDSLARGSRYGDQREHLLACSAASLRELYTLRAPTLLFGPIGGVTPAADSPSIDVGTLNPDSDTCWAHWATNRSMFAAVSPVALLYDWLTPPDGFAASTLLGVANGFVRSTVIGSLTFPVSSPEPEDDDKTIFEQALTRRMTYDATTLLDAYSVMSREADGVDAATNTLGLRFLGMGSNETSSIPPVPYSDRQGFGGGPTAPDGPEQMVSRMFWRSHLREQCSTPGLVAQLADRCVASIGQGSQGIGNSDVCTACVELAEANIPPCVRRGGDGQDFGPGPPPGVTNPLWAPMTGEVRQSKCDFLLGRNPTSAPPGLPSAWYNGAVRASDGTSRSLVQSGDRAYTTCGYPPWYEAVAYCTRTGFPEYKTQLGNATFAQDECHSGTAPFRFATLVSEENQGVASRTYLTPMVTALNDQETITPLLSSGFCSEFVAYSYGLDSVVRRNLSPLPIWDRQSAGYLALVEGVTHLGRPYETYRNSLKVPFCGLTQRASKWNKTCGEALSTLGVTGIVEEGTYSPASGLWYKGSIFTPATGPEPRCSVLEPRKFSGECPVIGGQATTCNSGGICVAGSLPSIDYRDVTP